MGQLWQQTDTASDHNGLKCYSGNSLASGYGQVECQIGGSAGSSEDVVNITGKAVEVAAIFESDTGLGVTSIPSGTWNVKVNVTTALGGGSEIQRIDICAVNSDGSNDGTIATWTGAVSVSSTGVKSIDVTQGSSYTCETTDRFYIQAHVYNNAHGAANIGITPSTTIEDTLVELFQLEGTIAGAGVVTGNLSAPWKSLAGTIAGQSTVTGNLGEPSTPPLVLQGIIAGVSVLAGVLGQISDYPIYVDNGGLAAVDAAFALEVNYPSIVNEDDVLVLAVGDADNDRFSMPVAAATNKNLFPDSSFRFGTTWTFDNNNGWAAWLTGQKYDGFAAPRVKTGTNAYGGLKSMLIPISGSTQYTWSWYLFNEAGSINYDFYVRDQDDNLINSKTSQPSTQDSWIRHEITFTTGSDDTYVYVEWEKSNDTTDIFFWLDAIQLETAASATSYLESPVSEWARLDQQGRQDDTSVARFWKRADGTETGTVRICSEDSNLTWGVIHRFENCKTTGQPFDNTVAVEQIYPWFGEEIHADTTSQYERANEWTADQDVLIDSVVVTFARNGTPTGDVWVEIWDESGGSPNAVITNGTSATIDVTTIVQTDSIGAGGQSLEGVRFSFATRPLLINTNVYFFVVRSDITVSGSNNLTLQTTPSDPATFPFSAWTRTQAGGWSEDSGISVRSLSMQVAEDQCHPMLARMYGATSTVPFAATKTAGTKRLCVALLSVEDDRTINDDATNYDRKYTETTAVGTDAAVALFQQRVASDGAVAADSCTMDLSDVFHTLVIALIPGGMNSAEGRIKGQSVVTGDLKIVTIPLAGTIAGQSTFTGDLEVVRELAGSIAGVGSVIGDLKVTRELAGVIAAQSTVTGNLEITTVTWQLQGTIAGVSAFIGDAKQTRALVGSIAGVGAVTGTLAQTHVTVGSIAGQSTVTGDLVIVKSLAGSIAGQSTVLGDLTQVEAVWSLQGAVAGQSTVTGDALVTRKLAGSIAANSSIVGDLEAVRELAGVIAAQSTFTGDLVIVAQTWQLQGSIASLSTVSGDLVVARKLAGAIAGQSTVLGDLTQVEAVWSLSGAIAGQSSVLGTLSQTQRVVGAIAGASDFTGDLKRDVKIVGSIAGQSEFLGDLTQLEAVWSLQGAIAGQSALSGTLVLDQALAGSIAGQSAVVGDLEAVRELAGSIDGQSAVIGDLTLLEQVLPLQGTIAGQSTFSGAITLDQALVGAIAGTSTVAADLKPNRKLAGAVAGQSTLQGDLTPVEAVWTLEGTVAAVSTVSGDLAVDRKLAGAIAGQSSVVGDLVKIQPLAGSIAAQSAVTGDLTLVEAVWTLSGAIAGTSTFSGSITATRQLAGSIAGQSAFLGDLTISEALWSLAGAIAGTGSVVGDLVVVKPLAGSIAGQSVIVGDLTKIEGLWVLAGAIAGQSTVAGTLTLEQRLYGVIAGQSEFKGALYLTTQWYQTQPACARIGTSAITAKRSGTITAQRTRDEIDVTVYPSNEESS